MHQCCVFGCKNIGNHAFPKDGSIRRKWELATRCKNLTAKRHFKVCAEHFKPEDFIQVGYFSGLTNSRRILKKGVVPSIFKWTNTGSPNLDKKAERMKNEVLPILLDKSPVDVSGGFDEMLTQEGSVICDSLGIVVHRIKKPYFVECSSPKYEQLPSEKSVGDSDKVPILRNRIKQDSTSSRTYLQEKGNEIAQTMRHARKRVLRHKETTTISSTRSPD